MHDPIRLAVLLSSNGTTLQNLIDRVADGRLKAKIALVISDHSDAYGLERARLAGIPTAVVERPDCSSREEFGERIFDLIRKGDVDLVCLAGFLRLLPIPNDFRHRVMNIHPSLIPAFCGKGFYGMRVHEAVVASGVRFTGCTVHFADDQYDHGPIILQRVIPVHDDDTAERLAYRLHFEEREAYPEAIRLFAEGRLRVEGRRVHVAAPSYLMIDDLKGTEKPPE
jgi:formyltetrahydrofolate-dependent phosphoribosylglycinamide formyltransferase